MFRLLRRYSTLPERQSTVAKFEFPRATHAVKTARVGENVVLNGWVDKKPKKMGKGLIFGKLRDTNGDIIQLVDRHDPPLIKKLQPESAITVEGKIEKQDLVVSKVQVLNESSIVGSQLTTGNTKEWPAEHRYLQIRSPATNLQHNLKKRARIIRSCRNALDELEFTEIETPLLFKSTPEGAREFLVPTRRKNMMYALPQSPQQYKQLLMASGVHKYYQVAKCFRDEDLRQDRQYEFTQLDMEMSFANGGDVRRVIESVVRRVWDAVACQIYNPNGDPAGGEQFQSLTYREAISRYGIDKPDLRSTIEITDVSEFVSARNAEFPVVEAIVLDQDAEILSDPTQYRNRMPVVIRNNDWSGVQSIGEVSDLEGLKAKLGCNSINNNTGQVIAISTRQNLSYENPTPMGRFRQLAIEAFPSQNRLLDNEKGSDFVATWVVDFPLFNPLELDATEDGFPTYDYNKYVTTHHPFTMAHSSDFDRLETAPLQVRGQHYDLVINGVEVGGGSTRIHDVKLQQYIFDHILRIPNSERLFGHLLRAFATGCPPHAGLALGLDRLVAMLCGTTSIRDVIAFPKTITGADPMIGCPSKVTPAQLQPYHIQSK